MKRAPKQPADPRVVVGYVRVSTDEQSLGPEAQAKALALYCKGHGLRLAAVFTDQGVSGAASIDRRPALLQAIEALRTERAGILLVAKRDRLARDVVVAAMIERLAERVGAKVDSADGTGNGDGPEALLLRGIVDVFAQYERALIRARTKAALAVKKARGERVGGIPFGKHLTACGLAADVWEEAAITRAKDLHAAGRSLRAIVAALTEEGHKPRGKRWHVSGVARMLKS